MVSLKPITLGSNSSSKKQGRVSRLLDIISAPLSKPKVTLTKGIKAGAEAVRLSREKIRAGDKKEAFKVIGTTLGTTALGVGGTLAAAGGAAGGAGLAARQAVKTGLTRAIIPKTIKGAAGRLAGVSVIGGLASTKGGREFLSGLPEKVVDIGFTGGQAAGKALEGEKPFEEGTTISDAFKAGGILGAGALLGAGLVGLGKNKDGGALPSPTLAEPSPSDGLTSFPKGGETEPLTKPKGVTRKRRAYKKKSEGVKVSQRVNVVVSQNQRKTKKYINKMFV